MEGASVAKTNGKTEAISERSPVVYVRLATWKRLTARKSPGMSMDDVITDLLDDAEAKA